MLQRNIEKQNQHQEECSLEQPSSSGEYIKEKPRISKIKQIKRRFTVRRKIKERPHIRKVVSIQDSEGALRGKYLMIAR